MLFPVHTIHLHAALSMTDLKNLSLGFFHRYPVTDTTFGSISYYQLFQHLRFSPRNTFQFRCIDIQKYRFRFFLIKPDIQFQHHIHKKYPFLSVRIRFNLQTGLQHRSINIWNHIHRTSCTGKLTGKCHSLFQPLQRVGLIIGHIQHKY